MKPSLVDCHADEEDWTEGVREKKGDESMFQGVFARESSPCREVGVAEIDDDCEDEDQ